MRLSFATAALAAFALVSPAVAEESGPVVHPGGPVLPHVPSASTDGGANASYSDFAHTFAFDSHNFSGTSSGGAVAVLDLPAGHASAGAVSLSNQFVQADAATVGDSFHDRDVSAGAAAEATYHVAIFGPDNIDVPLILSGQITANITASAQGSVADATAFFGFTGGHIVSGPNDVSADCTNAGVSFNCGTTSFVTLVTLKAFSNSINGQIGNVSLSAGVESDSTIFGPPSLGPQWQVGQSTAVATADPFFQIDPDFLSLHPGYSILFSDTVLNGAAPSGGVPEPASWALMIAGFALTGAALRRRRAALA